MNQPNRYLMVMNESNDLMEMAKHDSGTWIKYDDHVSVLNSVRDKQAKESYESGKQAGMEEKEDELQEYAEIAEILTWHVEQRLKEKQYEYPDLTKSGGYL
jgi:hypothetical protein